MSTAPLLQLWMPFCYFDNPFTQKSVTVSCEVVKQAGGLLVELTLSLCYDFVEQSCDFILKHLSIMQKQRYEVVL